MSRLFLIFLSLTLSNVKDFFSIVASLGGVVSLLFIAYQVNRQTKLAKAANSQSFVNVASSFVLTVGADKELMEFYQTGGTRFETLTPTEQARYRYLVVWWLTFYENVQYQQDCGLLDEGVYRSWIYDMEGFVRRRRVDHVWDHVKGNYSNSFVEHFQPLIDQVRREVRAAAPAPSPPKKP